MSHQPTLTLSRKYERCALVRSSPPKRRGQSIAISNLTALQLSGLAGRSVRFLSMPQRRPMLSADHRRGCAPKAKCTNCTQILIGAPLSNQTN